MDKYVLGNKGESERLDYQSKQRNYNSYSEVEDSELQLSDNSVALDAGCGTGIFARRIMDANPEKQITVYGIDASPQRINEARSFSKNHPHTKIKFKVEDLRKLNLSSSSVDLIVCRFVYEHLKTSCQELTNEFFRILKPSGRLIVIDTDGVLFNLDSENDELNRSIETIKSSNVNFEGYVCKKIPRYLQRSGFLAQDISVKPISMLFFEDKDREYEKELWRMRFDQIEPIFSPILGDTEYQRFSSQYIDELMNPENFLYYSKFVFSATKRDVQ